MANFCLPKKDSKTFLEALKSGALDVEKLAAMSSADRRMAFEPFVGKDSAEAVNALFESKLLLKNQQHGLISWARKVGGISEQARSDLLSKISKLDRVLQPDDEKHFLADLAAQKLGTTVTADEAQEIFALSRVAQQRKAEMLQDTANVPNRVAYGRSLMDLNDKIESMKPHGMSFADRMIDILNIPKSALTSILHFSAPFVQGWGMMSTARAWEAFGQMFRYFADENNYKDLNAYIITHPDYELAKDGKLGLTKLGDKLSAREEGIQSTLVEKANQWLTDRTGIPNLVRASSRAFTGYLNYVRFNRFADLVTAARLAGEDVRPGSSVVRDLAKVVNDFTGRGAIGIGDKYAQAAPALNSAFFSPRKISATMEMFNPVRYLDPRTSPTARKAAIRQLTGSLIATGAVLSIAKAMGGNVNWDPRSADFGKIGIGGEKLDFTGGNAIYLRLLARLATGKEITASGKTIELGKGYKPETRASLVTNYFRDKLSPVAGALADALYGTDPVGRPFDLTQEARDKLMPITMSDFINFAQNDPDNTAAMLPALTAIFGVGLESPLEPRTKFGLDAWGMPPQSYSARQIDPVEQEMKRVGITPNFPPQNMPVKGVVGGVPLTDDQYKDFIQTAGRFSKIHIGTLLSIPGWQSFPVAWRAQEIRSVIEHDRRAAMAKIQMESLNGPHDLVRQGIQAAIAARAVTSSPAPSP